MNDRKLPTSQVTTAASPADRAGRHGRCVAIFILASLLLLGTDLALKYWSFHHVAGVPVRIDPDQPLLSVMQHPHDPVPVIPAILSLQLTVNEGMVFGIGKGGRWFFVVVSIVAVGLISFFFARSHARAYVFHLALAMIMAGALGNLYDRIVYSGVRDMLYLFPDWHLPFGLTWPGGASGLYPWIFNIADVLLLTGLCIIFIITLLHERQRQKAEAAAD